MLTIMGEKKTTKITNKQERYYQVSKKNAVLFFRLAWTYLVSDFLSCNAQMLLLFLYDCDNYSLCNEYFVFEAKDPLFQKLFHVCLLT